MMYIAAQDRYEAMRYNRCGRSGLKLPAISLGLWHNFGGVDAFENSRMMARCAFDFGITHFDLANNYGPPYGSAETTFGEIHRKDLAPYRDELVISTKAGWDMWPGPYGDFGSRKYLIASLDQSLKRMGLEYVDIFYHHRPDPETPLEETMGALDHIVRSGKALYVGISSYSADETRKAIAILKEFGTPLLIHQPSYNLFDHTGKWLQIMGRVRVRKGVVTLEALDVILSKPPDLHAAGAPQAEPTPPPPPRPRRPAVVAFSLPLDGERDVPADTVVLVQFSRDMDEASLRDRVLLRYAGRPQPGDNSLDAVRFSYDGGLRTLRIDPGDLLRPGRVVEVVLLPGIVDIDGVALETRPGIRPGASADVLLFQVAGAGLAGGQNR